MERDAVSALACEFVESNIEYHWSNAAPRADFVSEVERIISLLGKQRFMRLSLLSFEIEGLSPSAAVNLVERALKQQGDVGLLPDGSVGYLYMGPRGKGMVADLALVHHIHQQLRQEIRRQPSFKEVRLAKLSVAHRWADEVIDAQDLVDALHRPSLESLQAC